MKIISLFWKKKVFIINNKNVKTFKKWQKNSDSKKQKMKI